MTDILSDALNRLVKLLGTSEKPMRISDVYDSMLKWLDPSGSDPSSAHVADDVIREAVSKLLTEMVIDYPTYDKHGNPQGRPEWHLKLLDEEEKRALSNLSPQQHALLRLLYMSGDSRRIGVVREEDAVRKLQEQGFDVSEIPWIEDRVSDYFDTERNERVRWVYLVPEYEKSSVYGRAVKRMLRKSAKQENREFPLDFHRK